MAELAASLSSSDGNRYGAIDAADFQRPLVLISSESTPARNADVAAPLLNWCVDLTVDPLSLHAFLSSEHAAPTNNMNYNVGELKLQDLT